MRTPCAGSSPQRQVVHAGHDRTPSSAGPSSSSFAVEAIPRSWLALFAGLVLVLYVLARSLARRSGNGPTMPRPTDRRDRRRVADRELGASRSIAAVSRQWRGQGDAPRRAGRYRDAVRLPLPGVGR